MFVEHKEQGEVTEAPAKTMKLSAAIRQGSKLRPQGRIMYFSNGRSCALGAAFEAINQRVAQGLGAPMWRALGITMDLHDEIVARNDQERWTREQIADWLESRGF